MQIESERPIYAPAAVHSTNTKLSLSSSSKDIVDGNPFSLNIVEGHPPSEPFYQEIMPQQRNQSMSSSAVYAVVNKKGANKPGIKNSISQMLSSKSYDSLNMLNNTNDMNLVSSIENLLEQHFMELKPKVAIEFKSMEDLITDVPNPAVTEVQTNPPIVANLLIEETSKKCDESKQTLSNPETNIHGEAIPLKALASEATIYMDVAEEPIRTSAAIVVHHTADDYEDPMNNLSTTASTCSSSIVLTESLCDEVIRGQNINDEIFHAMHRLESVLNFTEGASYAHAYPESDGFDDADSDKLRPKCRRQLSLGSKPSLNSESKIHKRLASSLRNSFQRGSRIFRISSVEQKAEEPVRRSVNIVEAMSNTYMQLLKSQIKHQLNLRPQLQRAIEVCRKVAGNFKFLFVMRK